MRNVTFKTILFLGAAGLMLTACGKKKTSPLVEPTATTYTRSWSQTVEYGTTTAGLPGSFVPGCIQVVNYKNNQTGAIEFQQLEFSSEVCPSGNVVSEPLTIRAKFHVKTSNGVTTFFGEDEDTVFGEYTETVFPNGSRAFELSELCSGAYSGNCTVTIEATKLKKIE